MRRPLAPGAPRPTLNEEAEWTRLRRHLELAKGFWLAFLFSNSPIGATVFEERTRHFLSTRGRDQVVVAPKSSDELAAAAHEVLALREDRTIGCIWIEAIFANTPGESNGRWSDAWTECLLALNQARQTLRNDLSAGLIIAAPATLKGSVRVAAPDLWSIRALVLDVSGSPTLPSARSREIGVREPDTRATVPNLSSFSSLAADGEQDERRGLPEKLRRVRRLSASGRNLEALELGREAVEEARSMEDWFQIAGSLMTLTVAEVQDGDTAAAADHSAEAIQALRNAEQEGLDYPKTLLISLLGWSADVAHEHRDLPREIDLLDEQIELCRQELDRSDDHEVVIEYLAQGLRQLGWAYFTNDDWEPAIPLLRESLATYRQLVDHTGQTLEPLENVYGTLDDLADVLWKAGETSEATELYREAFDLAQQISDKYGDSPAIRRLVWIGLGKLAMISSAKGDLAGARAAYEEALSVAQGTIDAYGESELATLDRSESLHDLGTALLAIGDIAGAKTLLEEAVDASRRTIERYGESSGSRATLAASLFELGNAQTQNGEESQATASYDEANAVMSGESLL